MANKILKLKKEVQRHSPSVRFIHWTVVVSTLVLIFSGFGHMPMYARYYLDTLPGLWWSSDYSVTLSMHYNCSGGINVCRGLSYCISCDA